MALLTEIINLLRILDIIDWFFISGVFYDFILFVIFIGFFCWPLLLNLNFSLGYWFCFSFLYFHGYGCLLFLLILVDCGVALYHPIALQ